jgi:hypothetical protein
LYLITYMYTISDFVPFVMHKHYAENIFKYVPMYEYITNFAFLRLIS